MDDNLRTSDRRVQSSYFIELIELANKTLGVISKSSFEDAPRNFDIAPNSDQSHRIEELVELLKKNDIEAIDTFSSIKYLIASRTSLEKCELIKNAIDILDFPTALKLLVEVMPDEHCS